MQHRLLTLGVRTVARLLTICSALVFLPSSVHAATLTVPSGGDLQAALDNAQPGDTILLQAGATFVGNFILPVKSGNGVITIRSSAADAVLPAAGARITPASSALLPKLVSPNSVSALVTAAGAHHY